MVPKGTVNYRVAAQLAELSAMHHGIYRRRPAVERKRVSEWRIKASRQAGSGKNRATPSLNLTSMTRGRDTLIMKVIAVGVGWAKRRVPNSLRGQVGHASLCPTYGLFQVNDNR